MMKKQWMLCAVLLTCAAMMTLGACETWRGAGKDMEHAGEKMQK